MIQKNVLEDWQEISKTTLDFLKCIPEDIFHNKPFNPRFKTFSWEFACILTTRKGYIRGINSGHIDGSCFVEKDSEFEKLDKENFFILLNETEDIISDSIKKNLDKKIDYFGEQKNIVSVIYWLLQHEQFHYGKLLLYLSKAEIKIPKRLKEMWGAHSF